MLTALGLQFAYWLTLVAGVRAETRRSRLFATRGADTGSRENVPPMSVVVAARNEKETLPRLLEALAAQTHPCFEVVVADDGSDDETASAAETFRERLPGLAIVRAERAGKKAALSRGIAAARHDLLAFTDADCIPPPEWLERLARRHARSLGDTLLVGYSPYSSERDGLLERLARYETFVTGFLTAGAAGIGRPYMAVGRNISYSRSLFHQAGGFEPIMHSLSGDDDLFVQLAADHTNADVRAIVDPRTFVMTPAPASWSAWFRQKRRHVSAGKYYKTSVKVHLALFHASGLAMWIAPFFLGWMGILLLALKLSVQGGALAYGARVLGERRLLRSLPLLEPLYVVYTAVAPAGALFAPRKW